MRHRGAMRRTIRLTGPFFVLIGGIALSAAICAAQKPTGGTGTGSGTQTGTHQTGSVAPASNGTTGPFDSIPSVFPDTSKQKRNDERQRRLVNDTQKLLALTAQLKAEVAASGAEAMTPAMLKEMDEIEKLAKSVKDKMRD